jgi:RimJ/RimL family protein N-acetyltransferase
LALDYLQAFPGQLRAVHYGEWLEGRVRVAAKHGNGCELEYDWRVIAGNDPCCSVALQECYLRTLSNSSVLIPDAGLRTVQRLAELSHGRFLWLAAGQGVIDERQLRFGAMSPPTSWSYQAPAAPVNFHALAYEQSRYGAWCWHGQQHEEGTVVQAIWRHDGVPMAQNVALKLSEHLRHFQPDDAVQLETLAAALSPESPPSVHLALLRSAHHDPRVLRTTLAHWVENPPELTDAERSYWGEAIAYAWEGCPRIGDEADLRYNMAVFAVQLGRLDIARIMFEHDNNRMGLAMCYSLGGRIDLALSCLEGIDDSYVDMLRSDLRRRMERWRMLGWYHAEASHDGELCLVPLDKDHALALYEQYRDPQIGDLTRLPDLDTPEAASEWIAEQSQETKRSTYALMHAGLGLIGIVSMHAHGEDAYFFFWIGSAHQGRGYGRRAARLLFRQAEYEGVRRLFTSAYRSNRRSTQALMAVQFRQLSIGALPPDDDLIFFVRDNEGRPGNEAALYARLAALLQANDSPIELASEFCAGEETMRDKSEGPGKNVLLPA